MWTLHVQRQRDSIDCLVTLQESGPVDGKWVVIDKPFERVRCRSGQARFTNTNWERGKSPIPVGFHKMTTKSVPLQMEPRGTPFFAIYTDAKDRATIGTGKRMRKDIGLHSENRFPGSAGCIVVVSKKDGQALFDYLHRLNAEGVTEINVNVFFDS